MPRMMTDDMEIGNIGGVKGFQFSGIRTEHLGATEYTLVTIAVDVTGSTKGFADDLRNALIACVKSCKRSPRSLNLLLRVITFSTSLARGIEEIHGFKPLGEIDPQAYPNFRPGGGTPLFDAMYSAIGAINAYSKKLMAQDFLTNGIAFIITDGDDTGSVATPAMIKGEIDRATKGEEIESLIPILIGINAGACKGYLQALENEVGMKYKDAGDATPGSLAKMAEFVSQSISSQSQAVGTGGPSQNISATI